MVKAAAAAARLEANAVIIDALVEGVEPEQARWKPEPAKWSVLEVINHLADEEVDDFRTRLSLTLHRPGDAWPAIDPEGWPAARGYLGRELIPSLDRFLDERRRSVAWLRGLGAPDWEQGYEHPKSGLIRAGDLLAAWLDHDLIHIRQLTRLHHQWLVERSRPYGVEYAGGW